MIPEELLTDPRTTAEGTTATGAAQIYGPRQEYGRPPMPYMRCGVCGAFFHPAANPREMHCPNCAGEPATDYRNPIEE